MSEHKEYEVGYKKPPVKSQFKKGVSGNPKGRPKGSKNLETFLVEELSQQIIINEGGRKKEVSKLEALVKQIVNKAIQGDYRAVAQTIKLIYDISSSDDEISPDEITNENDLAVINGLKMRMRLGSCDDK